jgi:hypothetical protein
MRRIYITKMRNNNYKVKQKIIRLRNNDYIGMYIIIWLSNNEKNILIGG